VLMSELGIDFDKVIA